MQLLDGLQSDFSMKVLSSTFICLCMLFEEFHVRFVATIIGVTIAAYANIRSISIRMFLNS
jgi:hypothetical protein